MVPIRAAPAPIAHQAQCVVVDFPAVPVTATNGNIALGK
jgi:hypothetical protein